MAPGDSVQALSESPASEVGLSEPPLRKSRALNYRPDIQGLRALAILAVVLYHAHIPGAGGGFIGVDFFFVLSGFLITGLLVAEVDAKGRVQLMAFWGRRARRLVPASALALIVTALVASRVLPLLDRKPVAMDTLYAVGFSANWRFVQQQTDYLAQNRAPSPVLHYWSLGVEEQFYVMWPLLIVAVCLLLVVFLRVTRPTANPAGVAPAAAQAKSGHPTGFRVPLVLLLLTVVVASFAWNVHEVTADQPAAFFGTSARVWQLAVGALLAVIAPALAELPRAWRTGLAVLGTVGFAWSVLELKDSGSGAQAYPGVWALVPTAAAAALIVAGMTYGQPAGFRWLSTTPLRRVGDWSYSWYLWHWPVIVLGVAWLGHDNSAIRLVLVIVALGIAVLSYRFVETPLRQMPRLVRSPRASLVAGTAFLGVAVLAGCSLSASGGDVKVAVKTAAGSSVTLRPTPQEAGRDARSLRKEGCDMGPGEVVPPACDYGDLTSSHKVVLLGDSHAVAAFPGIEAAARADGWHLNSWTKSGCPVANVTKWDKARRRVFVDCDTFRTKIIARVIALHPEKVLIANAVDPTLILVDRHTGAKVTGDAAKAMFVAGYRDSISQLTKAGIQVIVVRDFPRSPFDPPACLIAKKSVSECSFPRPSGAFLEAAAVKGIKGTRLIDLTNRVCGPTTCSPVQGDVLVYRDDNHITRTFAMTLVPDFERWLPPLSTTQKSAAS